MKISDRIFRFLVSFLCASAISVGNVFCLTTAFNIPVDSDLLILLCILASMAFSLAFVFKRGWIGVVIVSLVILGLCVYKWSSLFHGIILTVKTIMEELISAYDSLSNVTVIANVPGGILATSFMALLGALIAMLTAATVSRRYILLPVALLSTLLLVPCMLIIDSMPDAWAFILLVGAYVLMVMTQSRRRYSENGQYLMTLVMTLPIILLLSIITNMADPENYIRSQNMLDIRENFRSMMERYAVFERDEITGQVDFVSPIVEETLGKMSWNDNVSETDLSDVGPQIRTGLPVMSVYSAKGGEYYLKSNSLAKYEDNAWKALDEADYDGVPITEGLWTTDAENWESIQIRTNSRSSVFYLPYTPTQLPEGSEIHYDSYISNTNSSIEYTIPLAGNAPSGEISPEYEAFVHEVYTQVPGDTKAALSEITEQLAHEAWMNWDQDPAAVVAEYVRESAVYDLNTPSVPEGEDFAVWFLTESDTGYCVHFATAATVLLRCMDIPARYVTGYLVTADEGAWTNVTQDDAHAWVEFYMDGHGWCKLEPTPPAVENITVPEPTPPTQEEQPEIPSPVIPESEGSDKPESTDVSPFVWIGLAVLMVMVLWCPVVRFVRNEVLKRGTYNERAVKFYRRIEFLARVAKIPVPEDISELAMKARFSQHRLSKEELTVIAVGYTEICLQLRKDRRSHRYLLYHYVFALPKALNIL